MVFHVHLYGAPDGLPADLGPLNKPVENLRAGVTLFFVLSGFLLYRPFVAAVLASGPRPRVRNYFRNRAFRIIPAYWAILAVVTVMLQPELLARPGQLASNALFVQNYVPAYIGDGLGIVPAWSLCIEVVFYLVLPLLGMLAFWLASRRVNPVAACVAPILVMAAIGLVTKICLRALELGDGTRAVVDLSFLSHADWFAPGMAAAVYLTATESARIGRDRRLSNPLVLGVAAALLLASSRNRL